MTNGKKVIIVIGLRYIISLRGILKFRLFSDYYNNFIVPNKLHSCV